MQIICPTIKFHGAFICYGAQLMIDYFEISVGFRAVHPSLSQDSVIHFKGYRKFNFSMSMSVANIMVVSE